jgi:hypothetical protein
MRSIEVEKTLKPSFRARHDLQDGLELGEDFGNKVTTNCAYKSSKFKN